MKQLRSGLNLGMFSSIEKGIEQQHKNNKALAYEAIKKRTIHLEGINDLIEDIITSKGEITNDGYVICYYALSKYNKRSYEKDGTVSAGSDKIMLSTKNSANLKKFGDTIIKVKVPIEEVYFVANPSKDEVLLKIPFRSSYRKLNIKKYAVR